MTLTRRITIGLLGVALTSLVGWDIYVAANDVSGDTISEIVSAAAREFWTIPVAIGVVCGHWLWPLAKPRSTWVKVLTLSVLAGVTVGADLAGHPTVLPLLPFALGVVVGHFSWGQREV